MLSPANDERALATLIRYGTEPTQARAMLDALQAAGLKLADAQKDEFVCRWVNVLERAVPPEADTIIRTITTTSPERSTSSTFWLDGLRAPRL